MYYFRSPHFEQRTTPSSSCCQSCSDGAQGNTNTPSGRRIIENFNCLPPRLALASGGSSMSSGGGEGREDFDISNRARYLRSSMLPRYFDESQWIQPEPPKILTVLSNHALRRGCREASFPHGANLFTLARQFWPCSFDSQLAGSADKHAAAGKKIEPASLAPVSR